MELERQHAVPQAPHLILGGLRGGQRDGAGRQLQHLVAVRLDHAETRPAAAAAAVLRSAAACCAAGAGFVGLLAGEGRLDHPFKFRQLRQLGRRDGALDAQDEAARGVGADAAAQGLGQQLRVGWVVGSGF